MPSRLEELPRWLLRQGGRVGVNNKQPDSLISCQRSEKACPDDGGFNAVQPGTKILDAVGICALPLCMGVLQQGRRKADAASCPKIPATPGPFC